jgi:type IX secretion system PorP/SprF family membrane protein
MLASLLLISPSLRAQQDPLITQYYFNRILVNPAYAGMDESLRIMGGFRQSHTNIEGSPNTQTLTFHTPWTEKYMGFGARLMRDNVSVQDWYSLHGIYDYQLGLGSGILSLGLEAGLLYYTTDFAGLRTNAQDAGTPDPAIPEGAPNAWAPDFSFGAYYRQDEHYLGVSAYHLNEPDIAFSDAPELEERATYNRHFYLTAGSAFSLGQGVKLEPSALARYIAGGDPLIDLTALAQYRQLVGAGFSYRTNNVFALLINGRIAERWQVGYAYDLFGSGAAFDLGASHEFRLLYRVSFASPPRKKVTDPRYYN